MDGDEALEQRRQRVLHIAAVELLGNGRITAAASFAVGTDVVVGVRPEALLLGEGPDAEFSNVRARLFDIVYFGPKTNLLFEAAAPGDRLVVELARLPQTLAAGADVALRWRVEDTMVFVAP